jgi:hypothetical protein
MSITDKTPQQVRQIWQDSWALKQDKGGKEDKMAAMLPRWSRRRSPPLLGWFPPRSGGEAGEDVIW